MLTSVALLTLSLLVILLAAVLFTNSVEHLGEDLGMNQGATGSILAAIGTALPETLIPVIAVIFYSGEGAKGGEVAVGAIAGAPLMLVTLAMFVTGLAAIGFRLAGRHGPLLLIDRGVFLRDLGFFLGLYAVAVAATFLHDSLPARIAVAVLLVLAYGVYVRQTLKGAVAEALDLDPLYATRFLGLKSSRAVIVVQTVLSLAIMVAGAHLFVVCVQEVALGLGVPALILSLIIAPIATELPEKCNSVIWVGQKKDILALGNITGALVFQSSCPVVIGILFTPWDLLGNHGMTMVSALVALAFGGLVFLWVLVRRTLPPGLLLLGLPMYGIFFAYVLRFTHGG